MKHGSIDTQSIAIASYMFKNHKNAINYILAKFTQRALSIFHGPYYYDSK